jgi:uncharacterized membrane protein
VSNRGRLTLIKENSFQFAYLFLSVFPIPVGVVIGLKNFRRIFYGMEMMIYLSSI